MSPRRQRFISEHAGNGHVRTHVGREFGPVRTTESELSDLPSEVNFGKSEMMLTFSRIFEIIATVLGFPSSVKT